MRAALLTALAFFSYFWLGGNILLRFFRMVMIVMRYRFGDLGSGKLTLVFEMQYIGCGAALGVVLSMNPPKSTRKPVSCRGMCGLSRPVSC